MAATLQRPASGVASLTGELRVDPSYLVAVGGGQVLSHNGGQIVAAGGLNLVAAGGLNLVAAGGLNLVAAGGGNVISQNGGQAVPLAASGVISHNGGQYRLHAATAAAGFEVRVYDLATHRPIALGTDPAGQPVYGVLTDAAGRYEVFVPAAHAGNVLVQARVPGQADPRLAYDLVAPPPAATAAAAVFGRVLDDDTSVTTHYVRLAFARKLQAVLEADKLDVALMFAGTAAQPSLMGVAEQLLGEFRAAVAKAKVPRERYPEVATRCADALLVHLDLGDVVIDSANSAYKGPADAQALPAMVAFLTSLRSAVAAKLATDGPAFFDQQSYLKAYNDARPAGTPAFRLLRAADLGDFVIDAYVGSLDSTRLFHVIDACESVGLPRTAADPLFGAASGVGLRLGVLFMTDEAARRDVFAAIGG